MDNNVIVWIVVAIAALLAIALVVFLARRARNERRRLEAERLRAEVDQKAQHVEKRETVAQETEARARAAQAEAEAKAAEAARLQDRARTHRDAVNSKRDELEEHRARADALDPHVDNQKTDTGRELTEQTGHDSSTKAPETPAEHRRR